MNIEKPPFTIDIKAIAHILDTLCMEDKVIFCLYLQEVVKTRQQLIVPRGVSLFTKSTICAVVGLSSPFVVGLFFVPKSHLGVTFRNSEILAICFK